VLFIGALNASFTTSEWPSPLQQISPGDPNGPLLMVDLKLAEFAVTDRLDVIHRLLSHQSISPASPSRTSFPDTLSPIPRIIANVEVGRLSARLICVDVEGSQAPFSLLLESKGLNAYGTSMFQTKPSIPCISDHPYADQTGLRMVLQWCFHMEPVFLNLNTASLSRRVSRRFSTRDLNSEAVDSLLSLEAIEAKGTLVGLGEFMDDGRSAFNLLRTKSLFLDFHCYTEGVILEMWNSQTLAAVGAVLPALLMKGTTPSGDKHLVLPLGCAVSFSVARLVVFVTGRDINPNAETDVTCGVAFSTGLAVSYCAILPEQVHSVEHSRTHSQNRHKLYLPADHIAEALTSARVSVVSAESAAYGKFVLWNTAIRSAAADTYSMDDPYIFEKDGPAFTDKHFVFLHQVEVDVISRGTRLGDSFALQCSTHAVSASVDEVRVSFDLGHVLASLLALQVLRSIMPESRPAKAPGGPRLLSFSFRGVIKALQIRWNLPGQQAVTRINHLEATVGPGNVECCLNSLVFWVPIPAKPHRWKEAEEGRWEELGRLVRCTISYGGNPNDAILVEGDNLHFGVPSGYAFAELLLAITLGIKASHHIHRMVATGTHIPFPPPEVEGPKIVPNVSVSIRAICLEAADDPFESRLGLLLRTGLDAAKERLQREDAFDAKVAAILAAEGTDASPLHNAALSSDYQFDSGHSISVHDARERLHLVHSIDWLQRHRQRKQKRAVQENNFYKDFRGPIPMKRPTNVPNIVVDVSGSHRAPPLFRAVIYGFQLQLSRPSFPLEELPDFLYVQGRGVPKDTSYTLLIPMRLNFSLTSLQVTLRDYPLPLLYIPFHSENKELPVLRLISDLVIAEDMGTSQSVEWIPCSIGGVQGGFAQSRPLVVELPKTIMPVKTYANPTVHVMTDGVTGFGWGVSYSATTQDLVRVLESLTSEPRDPSPSLGFWDKACPTNFLSSLVMGGLIIFS
jgi:hypothetical protein